MPAALRALLPLLAALAACAAAAAGPAPATTVVPAPAPPPAPEPPPKILSLARPKGGEWLGLYVLGKKAGWAFSDLTRGELDGKKVVIATNEMTLKAAVGGAESVRTYRESRTYEHRDGGRLIAFRVEKRGDGGDETLVGACRPDGITLLRKRPGAPDETRTLPPTAEVVEQADAVRWVASTREKLDGAMLDLLMTYADIKVVTDFVDEGSYTAAGVTVPTLRVTTLEENSATPLLTTLARDGRALETRFGEVMVGKAEDEASAKKLEHVDMFALTRVQLPMPVPSSARSVPGEIVWRVRGLAESFRKNGPRQRFEPSPDGSVRLTVSARPPKSSIRRPVATLKDSKLLEALKPTPSIESDAPAIVELAKKTVGGETDAWTAARRLTTFVYGFVEKVYGTSSDRATDVLQRKKGDCTEHSLLLTALARAAGIPARRVDGLVYLEAADGVPAFYWHEWVEVYVGEWVSVDPTLGQPVADATHIAIGEEGQRDTAAPIGMLKIELVEARAKPAAR